MRCLILFPNLLRIRYILIDGLLTVLNNQLCLHQTEVGGVCRAGVVGFVVTVSQPLLTRLFIRIITTYIGLSCLW